MASRLLSFPTMALHKPLPLPLHHRRPNLPPSLQWRTTSRTTRPSLLRIRAAATDDGDGVRRWVTPRADLAEKVLRTIAGATSSPVGQFVASPLTFLHSVDPRIKLLFEDFL
ncbi:hypothetical protein QJS10_CPB15g01681 [Acorus calamus]|uniref:Uncharacterized protein n=1 Tax=Acorus calamus TaxID=4465 RepID=A0AAV9D2J9_ACOCL|nr:hypothetical protein QJS10_CPB15g01681 [Acorus calamus]